MDQKGQLLPDCFTAELISRSNNGLRVSLTILDVRTVTSRTVYYSLLTGNMGRDPFPVCGNCIWGDQTHRKCVAGPLPLPEVDGKPLLVSRKRDVSPLPVPEVCRGPTSGLPEMGCGPTSCFQEMGPCPRTTPGCPEGLEALDA